MIGFINPETGQEPNFKLDEYFGEPGKLGHVPLSQAKQLANNTKHLISQSFHSLRGREHLKIENMAKSAHPIY